MYPVGTKSMRNNKLHENDKSVNLSIENSADLGMIQSN
jgi:hypothetical protein